MGSGRSWRPTVITCGLQASHPQQGSFGKLRYTGLPDPMVHDVSMTKTKDPLEVD